MRGGSSKGMYLHAGDLPPPGSLRDAVILRLFGSPDHRQIDGLGGADVLTSKVAIVGPSSVPGADVDYTFGQVSQVASFVDYGGNCGNIAAGVGPFAIDESIISTTSFERSSKKTISIHNTNTKATLKATVSVDADGLAEVEGDQAIAGVSGTGSRIDLDFSNTQGSVTGKLLPTDVRCETISYQGPRGEMEHAHVTLLDAGQPTVFVNASSLGISDGDPADTVLALSANAEHLEIIERLRAAAAVRMGIVKVGEDAEKVSPYAPFVVLIGRRPEEDDDHDLKATCVFMQRIHKAYPVTGSVSTATAALLSGTVVNSAVRRNIACQSSGCTMRIRHPTGALEVDIEVDDDARNPKLLRASIARTARRLMYGVAYVPHSVWPA